MPGPQPGLPGSDRRRPPRDTVQAAIHARQRQPEPAPLRPARAAVAIRAGDLARRNAARLDTRGLWQVGDARRRPEMSHRGKRRA